MIALIIKITFILINDFDKEILKFIKIIIITSIS
jgi:hypothetical protein